MKKVVITLIFMASLATSAYASTPMPTHYPPTCTSSWGSYVTCNQLPLPTDNSQYVTQYCSPDQEYTFSVSPYVSQCSCPPNTGYKNLNYQGSYGMNHFICTSTVNNTPTYCADGTVVYNGNACPRPYVYCPNGYSTYGYCNGTQPQPVPLTQVCSNGSVISLYSQCPVINTGCSYNSYNQSYGGYSYMYYYNPCMTQYQPYNQNNYTNPYWGNTDYMTPYSNYPTTYGGYQYNSYGY